MWLLVLQEARMTAALKFEIGCPECGACPNVLTTSTPSLRSTAAVLECPACAATFRVTVTLKACDGRRYDIGPLIDALRSTDQTDTFVADQLGVDRRTLIYYRRNGVSDRTADRLATRLSLHPAMVWPKWWPEDEAAS